MIQTASMDFPDSAQRFNWCSCQPSVRASLSGLAMAVAPRPVTPIFDFSFWSSQLRGGGGAVATPAPDPGTHPFGFLFSDENSDTSGSWMLWLGLALAALVLFGVRKGHR